MCVNWSKYITTINIIAKTSTATTSFISIANIIYTINTTINTSIPLISTATIIINIITTRGNTIIIILINTTIIIAIITMTIGNCSRGVMVKAMDCKFVVSEFKLQSRYSIHFWTNTLAEKYEPLYPPSYGLNSTTTVL